MKKVTAMLLTLCMLFALAACGREEPARAVPSAEANAHTPGEQAAAGEGEGVPVLLSQRVYPFPAGCTVRRAARIGNRLLIAGYSDGTPVLGTVDITLSPDGTAAFGETKMLALDTVSPYNESLKGIAAGGDGCFYLLTGEHAPVYMHKDELRTNDAYQGRLAVTKLSPAGETLDRMEINGWPEDSCYGLAVDAAGRIYVLGADYVASFEWGNDDIAIVKKPDCTMNSIALTAQGVVISLWERSGNRYYLLDSPQTLKELAFEDPGDEPCVSAGNMTMCQGLDGEYIISSNSRFAACDVASGAVRELYQWDYTAFPAGAESACRLGESAFVCTVGEDFLLSTATVTRPKTERSVVNIAALDMENSNVGGIAAELNDRQMQYEYRIIEYGREEAPRLIADIISGGKIDMVIHNNLLDVSSDAFLDLHPYIDRDLGRESFIPNILETLSDGERLHELWEGVEIRTLAARTADVAGRENLTPQDYRQIVDSSASYEAVFQNFMDKENLLGWAAQVGTVEYMNRLNGTCSFDSAAFAELLGWCGDMCAAMPEGSDAEPLDISQVVLTLERVSDPVRIKYIGLNFGQPFTFVGFPTGGRGLSYFTCADNGSMAIPANSRNIDGAWAYIRSRLSMECQSGIDFLPVMRRAFTRRTEGVLDQAESRQLFDLVSAVSGAQRCADRQILDIITENGRMYLAGDKSLEETVKNIQSRASLYMAEQYR